MPLFNPQNRAAWEDASAKHVRENDELLALAHTGETLLSVERELLAPILAKAPRIVHLQSGHGLDDLDLAAAGARHVIGVDFSEVAATAAQGRAAQLDRACDYVAAALPGAPLTDGCADLVYTGKGALIWLADLTAWAADVVRLLAPGGHLFVYEAHPTVPLWTWDPDVPRIRPDRSYFAAEHVNDAYPARGAVESQHTLGEIVTACASAGLEIRHLAEYPDPFWRDESADAAAWRGRLPNAYSLLCLRPAQGTTRRTGERPGPQGSSARPVPGR